MRATGELSLIKHLRGRFPTRNGRGLHLGIGDDAALLTLRPGWQVVVTTDLLIEGRHFRRETHTAESAGHRCLARGLSDLAAMGGARPVAAFLSLALPTGGLRTVADRLWLRGFLRGFEELADRFAVPLAGGDTGETAGNGLLADIVLVGQVKAGQALLRSGAQPGDSLWVTGALGGAAAELDTMFARAARGRRPTRRRGPQSFPEPRLAAGAALARRGAAVTACMDVSDGLSTDLAHLCEESGVGARVEVERLPLHKLITRQEKTAAVNLALNGGEDYELLFATKAAARMPKTLGGVPLSRIGTLVDRTRRQPMITLVEANGSERALQPGGWEHLRGWRDGEGAEGRSP